MATELKGPPSLENFVGEAAADTNAGLMVAELDAGVWDDSGGPDDVAELAEGGARGGEGRSEEEVAFVPGEVTFVPGDEARRWCLCSVLGRGT